MKENVKISHTFKARCIKQYKQLEGVLDLGDEITIECLVSTTERMIHDDYFIISDYKGKPLKNPYIAIKKLTAPIGNSEGIRFLSKNGEYYAGDIFTHCLGYVPISTFLERISENDFILY